MKVVPRTECPVDIPTPELDMGVVVNAFRVLQDAQGVVYLDFCVYESEPGRATLAARVRVTPEFLTMVGSRIQEAVVEFQAARHVFLGSLATRVEH